MVYMYLNLGPHLQRLAFAPMDPRLAGGFPGGASGPSHPSHAELQQLRARLAQEELAIANLKQRGPQELWCFMPADGQPLRLRQGPHLDAQATGHMLAPGDRFTVAEKQTGHEEVTFLRLADGRGWAFDQKPTSSIWGWRLGLRACFQGLKGFGRPSEALLRCRQREDRAVHAGAAAGAPGSGALLAGRQTLGEDLGRLGAAQPAPQAARCRAAAG